MVKALPKPKFEDGEKVLCFHGPLIYEAKCLKSSNSKDKLTKYLIHYAGWNKSWDEWVPETRVLKFNDGNLQKQKDLQKAHSMQVAKAKKTSLKPRKSDGRGGAGSSTASDDGSLPSSQPPIASVPPTTEGGGGPTTSSNVTTTTPTSTKSVVSAGAASTSAVLPKRGNESGSDQSRKKRSRNEPSVEPEDQYLAKVEVKVRIPADLNNWLVDDWDMVVRQQKLVILPAKVSVSQLLDNFVASKKTNKPANLHREALCADIVTGIKEYFNSTLGSMLLYKFERPQYSDVLQDYPDTPMAQIYGAVHLLRMFVKIGSVLVYTLLEERNLQIVVQHIQEILKYLMVNRALYLCRADYGNASPDYHRKVQ